MKKTKQFRPQSQAMIRASNYVKSQKHVYRWLIYGCVLIAFMVLVGGITRLTQSGLSMVKWEPIMGVIPPMSEVEWNEVFDLYKSSPEFRYYNFNFTLTDFKSIFFWEYLHRLLARITGIVFIIPCIVFWIKGYFSSSLKKQVLLIFIFGMFQGVLGWIMVKSGLVDDPHVSHFRLAAHLVTALGLLMYIFWVAINLKFEIKSPASKSMKTAVKWFILLLFIQIIYGAFVAGLKAGFIYNTYPKMGGEWIPKSFAGIISKNGLVSLFDNPGIVQFIHRTIALIILAFVLVLRFRAKKQSQSHVQILASNVVLAFVFLQCVAGVITLLFSVPVFFGVMHQFIAILVLCSTFFYLFTLSKSEAYK